MPYGNHTRTALPPSHYFKRNSETRKHREIHVATGPEKVLHPSSETTGVPSGFQGAQLACIMIQKQIQWVANLLSKPTAMRCLFPMVAAVTMFIGALAIGLLKDRTQR